MNTLTVAVAWSQSHGLPLDQLLNPSGLVDAPRLETECRPDPVAQPLDLTWVIQPEWDAQLVANSAGQAAAPVRRRVRGRLPRDSPAPTTPDPCMATTAWPAPVPGPPSASPDDQRPIPPPDRGATDRPGRLASAATTGRERASREGSIA